MTVSQMREKITKVYPGETWKRKVINMRDDQVVAIYFHFLETNKFNQKPKKPKNWSSNFGPISEGEQLSFFD